MRTGTFLAPVLFCYLVEYHIAERGGDMKKNNNTHRNSLILGIGVGSGIALILSILLTALLTSLVTKGSITEEKTAIGVFAARTLSVATGGYIGCKIVAEKRLLSIGAVACAYLIGIIVIGIAVYGSSLYKIAEGAGSVFLGGVIAYLLTLKHTKRSRHRTKYTR